MVTMPCSLSVRELWNTIGAQQKAVALPDARADGPLEVVLGDRFARHLVAQVGDDGVADEEFERKLMNLRSTPHVVLGRVDVAARVQTHVYPAHDLARPARRVVL